jgi:hypothetical protein
VASQSRRRGAPAGRRVAQQVVTAEFRQECRTAGVALFGKFGACGLLVCSCAEHCIAFAKFSTPAQGFTGGG